HGRIDLLPDLPDAACESPGGSVLTAADDHPRDAPDVRVLRAPVPRRPGRLLDRVQRAADRAADVPPEEGPHRSGSARAPEASSEGSRPEHENEAWIHGVDDGQGTVCPATA